MSWLKNILLSSKNVNLDIDLEIDAVAIAKDVLENWDSFYNSKKEYLNYNMHYFSKYTNSKNTVLFGFFRANKNEKSVASYNEEENSVSFFPEVLVRVGIIRSLKSPDAAEKIASYMVHEITHEVDPKTSMSNYSKKREEVKKKIDEGDMSAYYLSDYELDAHIKQISYDMKIFANKSQKNKQTVLNWLRNGNLKDLLFIVNKRVYDPFLNAISIYPEKARMLRERIFHEITDQPTSNSPIETK